MPGCQPTLLDEELKRKASLTRRGAFLAELEAAVSRGTIVDATFVEAPVSTKNASGPGTPRPTRARRGTTGTSATRRT